MRGRVAAFRLRAGIGFLLIGLLGVSLLGQGMLSPQSHSAFFTGDEMKMQAAEVLRHLDEWMSLEREPVLLDHINQELADARLSVFRSEQHWVLVIETVVWFEPAGLLFVRDIYAYGNCLKTQGIVDWHTLFDAPELPLFKLPDKEEYDYVADPWHFSIVWQGQLFTFEPTPEDYAAAGITFEDNRFEAGKLEPPQLLRFLCRHWNHPFFASEAELRALIDEISLPTKPPLSHSLQLLLQTRHWQHPDLGEEELPSQVESFQVLARVIETGDLSEWWQLDPTKFNTTDLRYWGEKRRRLIEPSLSEGWQIVETGHPEAVVIEKFFEAMPGQDIPSQDSER